MIYYNHSFRSSNSRSNNFIFKVVCANSAHIMTYLPPSLQRRTCVRFQVWKIRKGLNRTFQVQINDKTKTVTLPELGSEGRESAIVPTRWAERTQLLRTQDGRRVRLRSRSRPSILSRPEDIVVKILAPPVRHRRRRRDPEHRQIPALPARTVGIHRRTEDLVVEGGREVAGVAAEEDAPRRAAEDVVEVGRI